VSPSQPDNQAFGLARPAVLIERAGSLSLVVGRYSVPATLARLNALATEADGKVTGGAPTAAGGVEATETLTIEMPAAAFPALLKATQALGRVSRLTTSETNVAGTYAALQAQIGALETDRHSDETSMTETLSASDLRQMKVKSSSVQSQITRLQGRLAALTNETRLARLMVRVR
jgi:Domain of unknown function (DUF4349)